MAVPSRNSYLQYKRDTNELVRWLITTSTPPDKRVTSTIVNLNGIRTLSKEIAATARAVPTRVYGLFQSVIDARSQSHDFYSSIKPGGGVDKEVEESNRRHKAFIDCLQEAFNVLGGEEWVKSRSERAARRVGRDGEDDEEEEEMRFINKFDGLEIEEGPEGDEEEEELDESEKRPTNTLRKTQGKKKGKGKGKSKAKTQKSAYREPEDIPLEEYRIEDDSSVVEIRLAAWAFMKDMIELRLYVQHYWRELAKGKDENAAVAGAVSNIAIGLIRQMQFEIAADFPGFKSFDSILRIVTKDDIEHCQSSWKFGFAHQNADGTFPELDKERDGKSINVREVLLINAHQDMITFLKDYRKNRNGKPTKAMAEKMKWKHKQNLTLLNEEKRIEWRSQYAFNWLYDLINCYASLFFVNYPSGNPEKFDWSNKSGGGPIRDKPRSVWGVGDFAADICKLAMQKTSAPLESELLPHHVFTLQIALDSMCVMRGWQHHIVMPKVELPLSKWQDNPAMKHVELFRRATPRSFINGAHEFLAASEADAVKYGDMRRHEYVMEEVPIRIKSMELTFGESIMKHSHLMPECPNSLFADNDSNGLWSFSPFTCGAALAEALNEASSFGIKAWDKVAAPLAMLHLYNLLMQNGHLPKKIDLLEELIYMFGNSCFTGTSGKPPTSEFLRAWTSGLGGKAHVIGVHPSKKRQNKGGDILQAGDRQMFRRGVEVRYFHDRSLLKILQDNDWLFDKIPDEDVPIRSSIAYYRLLALSKQARPLPTKTSNAPSPNKVKSAKMPETALVRRCRLAGILPPTGEEEFADKSFRIHLQSSFRYLDRQLKVPLNQRKEADTIDLMSTPLGAATNSSLLFALHDDIHADVLGTRSPYSGLNYLKLLAWIMTTFDKMHKALRPLRLFNEFEIQMSQRGLPAIVTHDIVGNCAFQTCIEQDMKGERCDNEILRKLGKVLWKEVDGDDEMLGLPDFCFWEELVGTARETMEAAAERGEEVKYNENAGNGEQVGCTVA